MEERALEMLAKKRDAAQILYGDMSATGLAALTGEGGIANDLVKALEQALHTEDNPDTEREDADLQTLFERTSLAHYASPWTLAVQAEGVQAEGEVLAAPAIQPAPVPVKTPPVVRPLPPRPIRQPQLPRYQPVPIRAEDAVQPRLF
ncbi:MAG: hypothetical protein L0154_26415 [Chloroflexi bacterium]|nr:hypothetical protein [Chloroflexota bacterium]